MTVFRLFVAGDPRPKGSLELHLRGKRLRIGSTFRQMEWEAQVRATVMLAYKGDPMEGPVRVTLRFGMGRGGWIRRDLDKLVRCILDALSGVVYKDDRQVTELSARKEICQLPGVEITVEPLP